MSLRYSVLLVGVALLLSSVARAAEDRTVCIDAYERSQQLRRVNDLVAARDQLLRCEAACPKKFVSDCALWRGEVETFLPSLIVTARREDGRPAAIDALFVDGRRVVPPPRAPIWLTPGNHVVRVHGDGAAGEVTVSLRAEEHDRRLPVVVSALETRPATTTGPRLSPPTPDVATGPSGRSRAPAFVLLGTGAAALAAAGVLTVLGHIERDRLEDACAPECARDDAGAIETTWLVGGALAAAGVAALGAAWLVWPRGSATSGVSLRVGPTGGALLATF